MAWRCDMCGGAILLTDNDGMPVYRAMGQNPHAGEGENPLQIVAQFCGKGCSYRYHQKKGEAGESDVA